jgi:hypothetical protein
MKQLLYTLILVISSSVSVIAWSCPPWGFHAHKIINRMAVFILPPEMMVFYKKNIDYLTEHATDPDKRRYAVSGEAIKHFMDIDYWGENRLSKMPKTWEDALATFIEIRAVGPNDTLLIKSDTMLMHGTDSILINAQAVFYGSFKDFIHQWIKPEFGTDGWSYPVDSFNEWLNLKIDTFRFNHILCEEHFTDHGINPYHIKIQYDRLANAFRRQDASSILHLSADLGHYIADTHVPLHATQNYNGQLTGQEGIHAFWETRIPELFADEIFDFFVGKASYIRDVEAFAWKTIIESNELSHIVLNTEAELQKTIPENRQYGYHERLNQTVRSQTEYYSKKYHEALGGMVEQRMRAAIHALGSLWLSAWIEAGQPVLGDTLFIRWTDDDLQMIRDYEKSYQAGSPIGRDCK